SSSCEDWMSESSSIGDPPCHSVVIVLSNNGQAQSLSENDLTRNQTIICHSRASGNPGASDGAVALGPRFRGDDDNLRTYRASFRVGPSSQRRADRGQPLQGAQDLGLVVGQMAHEDVGVTDFPEGPKLFRDLLDRARDQ